MDCHKQYTKVSDLLGSKLDTILEGIERFYYSDFWTNRFRKRLKEEELEYLPIHLDIIQGVISELRDNTKFKLFEEEGTNGVSNKGTMIALNSNLTDDAQINNIIMHEFGHRQYNQSEFNIIVFLNKQVIKRPGFYLKNNEVLNREDYKYFIDHNEIRQRIIPIIKEMYDNNWTAEEAYELSQNLRIDDIKDIFIKDYIIYLLNNIL